MWSREFYDAFVLVTQVAAREIPGIAKAMKWALYASVVMAGFISLNLFTTFITIVF